MQSTPKIDVVVTILPRDGDNPVGVVFQKHAAIYFLDTKHPHFDEILSLLVRSRDEGVSVEFSYMVDGQFLTTVALVEVP